MIGRRQFITLLGGTAVAMGTAFGTRIAVQACRLVAYRGDSSTSSWPLAGRVHQ
jgi:hypothetical protein